MDTVKIECSRPYEVLVGAGLLDTAGEHIARTTGCQTAAVVADDTVDALYGDRVQVSLERAGCRVVRFRFPHGEQSKTIATYVQLLHFLAENRLTRSDAVVALGGGVTGDLAGFAAATFMRGMALVQLPTTLLAAVDSSVGGKTAVDLPQGKNLAGVFHQPSLVLCDCDTLDTLPADVFRDGCAEVIKYGVLCDAQFFESLQKPVNEQREAVISRCVRIKSDIVSRDERDKGERQLLNLGHTIGHAIEQCSGFTVSHRAGGCHRHGTCSPRRLSQRTVQTRYVRGALKKCCICTGCRFPLRWSPKCWPRRRFLIKSGPVNRLRWSSPKR